MTTTPKPRSKAQSISVMLTVGMLVAAVAVFVIVFASATPVDNGGQAATLTADTYVEEVTALLANADAARGEALVTTKYECGACHIQGAGRTAPEYAGLSERAAAENPPLTAEAYIYEALIFPTAHIVEGYANTMPANYKARLSEQELGDMIAYLLTQ